MRKKCLERRSALSAYLCTGALLLSACGGPPPDEGPIASAPQAASAPQKVVVDTPAVWGFAWAGPATTGTYLADPAWACRSYAGGGTPHECGDITVQWLAGGADVLFPELGGSIPNIGTIQVTAQGPGNVQCTASTFGPVGSSYNATGVCFNSSGLVNTNFSVSYMRRSDTPGPGGAYVWATGSANPVNVPYTPDPYYRWNSTGAAINITRTGTGAYTVRLLGQSLAFGSAQVSANSYIGNPSPILNYCKVSTWGVSNGNTDINVRCFSQSGAPMNATFHLNYNSTHYPLGGNQYSYVWANNSTSSSYTPAQQKAYMNDHEGGHLVTTPITAGRYSTGSYFVDMPEMQSLYSTVLAQASGTAQPHCKVVDWYASGAGTRADVNCFNASTGAAVNTNFNLLFTSAWYPDF
jgi:hypothetical protein